MYLEWWALRVQCDDAFPSFYSLSGVGKPNPVVPHSLVIFKFPLPVQLARGTALEKGLSAFKGQLGHDARDGQATWSRGVEGQSWKLLGWNDMLSYATTHAMRSCIHAAYQSNLWQSMGHVPWPARGRSGSLHGESWEKQSITKNAALKNFDCIENSNVAAYVLCYICTYIYIYNLDSMDIVMHFIHWQCAIRAKSRWFLTHNVTHMYRLWHNMFCTCTGNSAKNQTEARIL